MPVSGIYIRGRSRLSSNRTVSNAVQGPKKLIGLQVKSDLINTKTKTQEDGKARQRIERDIPEFQQYSPSGAG
jgi:hypothetical protein